MWALTWLFVCSPRAKAVDKVSVLTTGKQPGHYWVWNDKPILPIGDSATQGWMESGTNFNQTGYIDALASRGVNLAMIWSYIGTDGANQTNDPRIKYDAPELWPWQGSIESDTIDLGQFNQSYFNRLRDFVEYAESKEIIVLITVHDGWTKQRFDRHPFNDTQGNGPLTANTQYVELHDYDNEMSTTFNPNWTRQEKNQYYQELFADKLITELEPYSNVVFEMFNEGEWYNATNRRRHENHFLKFFADRTDALLMTNTDHITGDTPYQNANADVISLHQGQWTGNYDEYASTFANSPAKPLFMSEAIPEFNGVNVGVDVIRRSAWEAAMAGTGWVAQNDTSFGWDPETEIESQANVREEVYAQIGRVTHFMNHHGVPFWNMAPQGSLSNKGIVLADPGHEYLLYIPTGGGFISLNLAGGSGQQLRYEWYDPRTGVTTSGGTLNATGTAGFIAPDSNDWVLRVGESQFPTTNQVTAWEFNTDGDQQNWTASSTAGTQGVSAGVWNLVPSGSDPMLVGPAINVAADLATIVEIGIRSSNSNTSGQLFWTVQGDAGFSEERSQIFKILGDGQMRSYRFDLAIDPDWSGQITGLRLDPVTTGNGTAVTIDFIRLLSLLPLVTPGDYNEDGTVDAADYVVWRNNVGAAAGTLPNDVDGGTIGPAQYNTWQANFGLTSSAASNFAANTLVPEPTSVALLLLAAAGSCFWRLMPPRSSAG